MSEMIRAFIAFDLDNEQLIKRIAEIQEKLVNTGVGLKIVKPQNIHVTLRFMGNIDQKNIERIYEAMKEVQFNPFTMEVKGLGVFPNLSYIRVIWAGITVGAEELKNIHRQLEPKLNIIGFKPDRRFSPHLTIARVRSARNKNMLVKLVKDSENYIFGTQEAKVLRLKKSVLAPKGPIYTSIYEVAV